MLQDVRFLIYCLQKENIANMYIGWLLMAFLAAKKTITTKSVHFKIQL